MPANLSDIFLILQRIREDLPALLERSKITAKQIITVTGLSDITERLGLIQAGEFRTGNSKEPGYGFSGVRMGYPSFVYNNEYWNLVGVQNDVLQFGLNSNDGKAYAGGGKVTIDSDGITIQQTTTATTEASIKWTDTSGNEYFHISSYGSSLLSWIFMKSQGLSEIESFLISSDGTTQSGVGLFAQINHTTVADIQVTSTGIQINAGGYDVDTSIRGDTNQKAFYLDAGLDKLTSLAWDGWIDVTYQTWTRTGNFTFTVSGDVTAQYRKGTKVRYKDGGSYEYGVIGSSSYSSPNTTITLISNTDYAMAAATITDTYISYIDNPEGFPTVFNFTPTFSANGTGTPNYTVGTLYHNYWIAHLDSIEMRGRVTGTTSGSTVTDIVMTVPIAYNGEFTTGVAQINDGGTIVVGRCGIGGSGVSIARFDASNFGIGTGRVLIYSISWRF